VRAASKFQSGQDLADEPHWCSSVFGCRKAYGLAGKIEIVCHDVVMAKKVALQLEYRY
jgi:hypothetical protein